MMLRGNEGRVELMSDDRGVCHVILYVICMYRSSYLLHWALAVMVVLSGPIVGDDWASRLRDPVAPAEPFLGPGSFTTSSHPTSTCTVHTDSRGHTKCTPRRASRQMARAHVRKASPHLPYSLPFPSFQCSERESEASRR